MSDWNSDIRDVIDTYSDINLALLICCNDLCTNNSTRITSEWRDDISTSYLIQLRCTECDIEWMVCKHCCLKKNLLKMIRFVVISGNIMIENERLCLETML